MDSHIHIKPAFYCRFDVCMCRLCHRHEVYTLILICAACFHFLFLFRSFKVDHHHVYRQISQASAAYVNTNTPEKSSNAAAMQNTGIQRVQHVYCWKRADTLPENTWQVIGQTIDHGPTSTNQINSWSQMVITH